MIHSFLCLDDYKSLEFGGAWTNKWKRETQAYDVVLLAITNLASPMLCSNEAVKRNENRSAVLPKQNQNVNLQEVAMLNYHYQTWGLISK